jgi:hypothetical protein
MAMFMISSHHGGFSITERHNNKNTIEVTDGEFSETAMKSIAYKMLTMIETDKIQ